MVIRSSSSGVYFYAPSWQEAATATYDFVLILSFDNMGFMRFENINLIQLENKNCSDTKLTLLFVYM